LDFRVFRKNSNWNLLLLNWWVFSDHTIIQGHHWVKHHMFNQMPLLVDQVDFRKSFNKSLKLESKFKSENSQ
jgi:hypothetical protein